MVPYQNKWKSSCLWYIAALNLFSIANHLLNFFGMMQNRELLPDSSNTLIALLQERFQSNMHRHSVLAWPDIVVKLQANMEKLWSLNQMEQTGGEPDVVGFDTQTGEFLFCDCSKETPKGRRSLCYDDQALNDRKENKPAGSAKAMAASMGVELLTEHQYKELQQLEPFDAKTSSWIETPSEVRKLGGALFGDYRYGRVFIYHNGAASYYAVRGFRAMLRI